MSEMSNRGIMYGDGFFETMAVINGHAPLLSLHFNRIQTTAEFLRMELPSTYTDVGNFEQIIRSKCRDGSVRLRLTFVREHGGLYLPNSNRCVIMSEIYDYDNIFNLECRHKSKVAFSETLTVVSHVFSRFKLLSKSDRVLMALENQERGTDDLIVCDSAGYISEAIASNIFFMTSPTDIVTPGLDNACLDGVMRRFLLDRTIESSFTIAERSIHRSEIQSYRACFITNAVTGVVPIAQIESMKYDVNMVETFAKHIQKMLGFI